MNLLSKSELPRDFVYPEGFISIIDKNLTDLSPWWILSDEGLRARYEGLKMRYTLRKIIPFAARVDNDDVACFNIEFPNEVIIIHDYADPGWEYRGSFNSFWVWFKQAIDDMIEHES